MHQLTKETEQQYEHSLCIADSKHEAMQICSAIRNLITEDIQTSQITFDSKDTSFRYIITVSSTKPLRPNMINRKAISKQTRLQCYIIAETVAYMLKNR